MSSTATEPRPYRRRPAPTFVVAVTAVPERPPDLLRTGYPLLVRGLANLAILLSDEPSGPAAHFVTLEQGTYTVEHTGDDTAFFTQVPRGQVVASRRSPSSWLSRRGLP